LDFRRAQPPETALIDQLLPGKKLINCQSPLPSADIPAAPSSDIALSGGTDGAFGAPWPKAIGLAGLVAFFLPGLRLIVPDKTGRAESVLKVERRESVSHASRLRGSLKKRKLAHRKGRPKP
jgi:hypothetical protein